MVQAVTVFAVIFEFARVIGTVGPSVIAFTVLKAIFKITDVLATVSVSRIDYKLRFVSKFDI